MVFETGTKRWKMLTFAIKTKEIDIEKKKKKKNYNDGYKILLHLKQVNKRKKTALQKMHR